MKREWKREQTLRLLLDTTSRLVEEKGCVKTTMSEIMRHSGLSKGAIFHYVKSKDELLSMVLEQQMAETDRRFREAIEKGGPTFEGPMGEIASGLPAVAENNVANRIFRYLLGRSDEPEVGELVARFYDKTVRTSVSWIEAGQTHGVIPASIDARRAAETFVLLSNGLRMRSGLPAKEGVLAPEDVAAFIRSVLQPGQTKGERQG